MPSCSAGFQYARTGVAQTYILCYEPSTSPPNARSYIEAPLNKTLQIGKRYCVKFFVNLSNPQENPFGGGYAISDLGAYFSDTAIISTNMTGTDFSPFSFQPQINNPVTNYLTDTLNWMPISGSFTAKGGEKYITIGTFVYNNTQLHVEKTFNFTGGGGYAIYFIDDVSVIELPTNAAGVTTTVCAGDSVQIGTVAEATFTYKWFPEAGLRLKDSINTQPWVKPTQTTIYYLTVQDSAGCSSTDSVVVTICQTEIQTPTLQVPNVITPNNDGKNDAFYIENLPEQSKLEIFNRWGNSVYHSLNYQNNWEAANVGGGTYYYLLTLPSGEVKKGFLEIIK